MQLLSYLVVVAFLWSFGCYLATPESAPGEFAVAERILLIAWYVGAIPHFLRGDPWRAPLYLIGVCFWVVAEQVNGAVAGWSLFLFWSCLALVLLQVETVLAVSLKGPRVFAVMTSWLPMFFFFFPAAIIYYWYVFGEGLGTAAVVAVLQSNLQESFGFVRQFIGWDRVAPLVAVALLIFFVAIVYGLRQSLFSRYRQGVVALSLVTVVLVITSAGAAYSPFLLAVEGTVSRYFTELERFRDLYQARKSGLGQVKASHSGDSETWVMVIGESHNARHMGVNGYWRDTTPNLNRRKNDPRLVWLSDAYSNHTHTVPALTLALTQANQYNGKDASRSPSVIEVARAAGFTTYWISNQVRYGAWDSAVTVLADHSDEVIYENENIGATTQTSVHDEALIKRLQQVLRKDGADRKLIVVHVMGSHSFYCARFPGRRGVYSESGQFFWGRAVGKSWDLNCYDDSVRYNDHVLEGILSSVGEDPNFSGLLYFSDHGESVASGKGHNSAVFSHDMTEIPAWLWLAEDEIDSSAVNVLKEHSDRVFTNDLVYDTLIGLMGIETPAYDEEYDLSSPHYGLSPVRAKLMHGEHGVEEHPVVHEARFLDQFEGRTLLAHRVNTLAKLGDALSRGYSGFETDLYLQEGEDGIRFEVGHDKEHLSGGSLGEMLKTTESVVERSFEERALPDRVWLDIKNLDPETVRPALDRLQSLQRRHSWFKDAALVETSLTDKSVRVIADAGWHVSYYLPTRRTLDLLARGDDQGMRALATEIAARSEEQGLSAVSFDQRLYPFVRDYLGERLSPRVVYHAWDLSVRPEAVGAPQLLAERSWVHDKRLETLIVPMGSDFDL